MDARALAVSTFVHVCAGAALCRGFAPSVSREISSTASEGRRTFEVEIADVDVEVDAPKARPNGSLAGSDRAGAIRASGPNRATDGSRGEDAISESPTDTRFGMVTLVASSLDPNVAVTSTPWAPPSGGGADGLYAGSAFGDGAGASGLGIGAAHDGFGIGMGTIGARGLAGHTEGAFANERAWSNAWGGGWTAYGNNRHFRFPGPHVKHPTELSPIGPLDGAVIIRGVRSRNAELVRCYVRSLEAHPHSSGGLRVEFVTARDGTVVGAKDGGGSAGVDAALVRCMTTAFATFTFPEAPGLTRVSYAMELYVQ